MPPDKAQILPEEVFLLLSCASVWIYEGSAVHLKPECRISPERKQQQNLEWRQRKKKRGWGWQRKGVRLERRSQRVNADNASVSDWRSLQVRDTKELTVLITMRHYGHGAVWLYINGPWFFSAIGPSALWSAWRHFSLFTSASPRSNENSRLISDFQVNSQNSNDQ